MKKLFVLALTILLAFACNSANKNENVSDDTQEVNMENLVETVIPVHGMTCEGCENAINKSVGSLAGIAEVKSSHLDSITTVKFDTSAVTLEEIELKIAEAGYTVAR